PLRPVACGPILASARKRSVVSVRSTAWVRLTQPFSIPIGYAVSEKPTEAMLANGREGKRSGVSPFTSLVVSQKNWNVRRSMSRNSGGSSGGPGGSSGGGSGSGSTTCGIGPGLGGSTTGCSGSGACCRHAASSRSKPASASARLQDLRPTCISPLPVRRPSSPATINRSCTPCSSPIDPERQLELPRGQVLAARASPVRVALARRAVPVVEVRVVDPVEHVQQVGADAEPDLIGRRPFLGRGDVELLEADGALRDEPVEEAVVEVGRVVAVDA